jgi:hypothetical protein
MRWGVRVRRGGGMMGMGRCRCNSSSSMIRDSRVMGGRSMGIRIPTRSICVPSSSSNNRNMLAGGRLALGCRVQLILPLIPIPMRDRYPVLVCWDGGVWRRIWPRRLGRGVSLTHRGDGRRVHSTRVYDSHRCRHPHHRTTQASNNNSHPHSRTTPPPKSSHPSPKAPAQSVRPVP